MTKIDLERKKEKERAIQNSWKSGDYCGDAFLWIVNPLRMVGFQIDGVPFRPEKSAWLSGERGVKIHQKCRKSRVSVSDGGKRGKHRGRNGRKGVFTSNLNELLPIFAQEEKRENRNGSQKLEFVSCSPKVMFRENPLSKRESGRCHFFVSRAREKGRERASEWKKTSDRFRCFFICDKNTFFRMFVPPDSSCR